MNFMFSLTEGDPDEESIMLDFFDAALPHIATNDWVAVTDMVSLKDLREKMVLMESQLYARTGIQPVTLQGESNIRDSILASWHAKLSEEGDDHSRAIARNTK